MTRILVLARHEWRRYFATPLAWTTLGVACLIAGIVFGMLLAEFAADPVTDESVGATEFIGGSLFGFSHLLLLLIVPILSMRSFAEERQTGSLELLLGAPLNLAELVLGKFLGMMLLLGALLAIITAMPLTLAHATDLDQGRLATEALGLLLIMAAFASAGLFMSALTRQPVAAAISAFGLLLGLWLLEALAYQDGRAAAIARALSPLGHVESLQRGLLDTADIGFFAVFSATFLGLTVLRLAWERHA